MSEWDETPEQRVARRAEQRRIKEFWRQAHEDQRTVLAWLATKEARKHLTMPGHAIVLWLATAHTQMMWEPRNLGNRSQSVSAYVGMPPNTAKKALHHLQTKGIIAWHPSKHGETVMITAHTKKEAWLGCRWLDAAIIRRQQKVPEIDLQDLFDRTLKLWEARTIGSPEGWKRHVSLAIEQLLSEIPE